MNKQNIIYCDTVDQLLDIVAGLVKRGIMYRADVAALTVETTGGF